MFSSSLLPQTTFGPAALCTEDENTVQSEKQQETEPSMNVVSLTGLKLMTHLNHGGKQKVI